MAELRSLFNRARTVAASLTDRGLATYAASCAFYMFLSLFPMAALAASLLPCMGISEAALLSLLDGILPLGVASLFRVILSHVYERVFPVLPVSILVLFWSAAQAFSELLKGMTAMTGAAVQAGFLKRRLRGILLTAGLLLTVGLSLSVLIFGIRVALVLSSLFPKLSGLVRLCFLLGYILMALLLWLLCALLYRAIPGAGYAFREVRGIAALAAGAWLLFSGLFSLFVDRFFDLSLYGGMAAIVLTMLWLFYCQYILLAGAGLCAIKRKPSPIGTAS